MQRGPGWANERERKLPLFHVFASRKTQMILSEASERALEFPSLLDLLAQGAATDLGRERLLALRPTADVDDLARRRRHYEEVARLLADRGLVPSRERELQPILRGLERMDQDLDGRDLIEIGALIETTGEAASRIRSADPPCPALGEKVAALAPLDDLARKLRKTFDGRGEIREDATPRLAELRGRIRSTRQKIYDQLSGSVELHREHLSEETIPMRGGRLVLVLQSGARGRVPGLVHGRSGSGKSFYFEPLDAVEPNNQLQQAVEDEQAEKARILLEVIGLLRGRLAEIRGHAELLGELDLQQAASRFAASSGGQLAEIAPRHQVLLCSARHPLLDPALSGLRQNALGKEGHTGGITPLELELGPQKRALVITGPNAGGKTVALKTTALFALLHQCGLPLPAAAGSRMPVFEAVVATVGDDQDMLADRSTFSGRLLRLREAWEEAGRDSLVVLDELGSGTDPEEGAALSVALLEGLLQRGGLILATTHLTQVAAFALEAEGAFVAAMQFDSRTGQPTYRLLPGPPGGSEALSLAQRLGLPTAWTDRAEELLGSEHRDLRRMLEELERHRAELQEVQARLEEELAGAESLRRRLAEREQQLADEKRGLAEKLRRQLETFRNETQHKLRLEIEALRQREEQRKQGRPVETRLPSAGAIVEQLFAEAPALPEDPEEELPLKVGGLVRHRRLGWIGTLEKLERGKAQVKVEGRTMLCKETELAGSSGKKEPARKPSPGELIGMRTRPNIEVPEIGETKSELNLIGQRVEAALAILDDYLDRAVRGAARNVRIIHGHGSGKLRNAVREHLRAHRAVTSLRAGSQEEGGDGATVVELDR
jgi:DNA mismatch repair protein MutS2